MLVQTADQSAQALEMTKENYEDYIAKEKAFYTSYDYDQLFGEQE